MSEGNFSKETEQQIKKSSLFGCYMSLMENLLFPHETFDENFKPPPVFKKLENTFASPEKFDELKEGFRKIFSREKGKYCIFGNQKKVLKKYYGLDDGDAYYLHTNGVEEIAEELGLNNQEVEILKEAGEQNFNKAENFNLLPEEAKKLAKL